MQERLRRQIAVPEAEISLLQQDHSAQSVALIFGQLPRRPVARVGCTALRCRRVCVTGGRGRHDRRVTSLWNCGVAAIVEVVKGFPDYQRTGTLVS
jgi:hypothetical protein